MGSTRISSRKTPIWVRKKLFWFWKEPNNLIQKKRQSYQKGCLFFFKYIGGL